jgi:hypothetical protein
MSWIHLARDNVELRAVVNKVINMSPLLAAVLLVSCLASSSTLKIEAVRSSETLVYFYRTKSRYLPDDTNSSS